MGSGKSGGQIISSKCDLLFESLSCRAFREIFESSPSRRRFRGRKFSCNSDLVFSPVSKFMLKFQLTVRIRSHRLSRRVGTSRGKLHSVLKIHRQKFRPNGRQEEAVEGLAFAETDFGFGGMDVDIDLLRRHFEEEIRDRLTPHHEEAAVGFGQSVLQRSVLDPSTVQKKVLPFATGLALGGMGDVSPDPVRLHLGFDPDQLFGEFAAVKQPKSIDQFVHGREFVDDPLIMSEDEMKARIGKSDPRELLADVSEFGSRSFQEFSPDGRIEEKISDLDSRPDRCTTRASRL